MRWHKTCAPDGLLGSLAADDSPVPITQAPPMSGTLPLCLIAPFFFLEVSFIGRQDILRVLKGARRNH